MKNITTAESSKSSKLNTKHQKIKTITNFECILLEDTSATCAPVHLEKLLKGYDFKNLCSAEILFLLIYVVALESGFIAQDAYEAQHKKLANLQSFSSFHARNVAFISQFQPNYQQISKGNCFRLPLVCCRQINTNKTSIFKTSLTALVTGDLMIVTLLPQIADHAPGFSTCLPIERYIINSAKKSLGQRFNKLKDLSRSLKDQIFMPALNYFCDEVKANVYPAMQGLPQELYAYIFEYLNTNQLKVLANVNKKLNRLAMVALKDDKNQPMELDDVASDRWTYPYDVME